MAMARRNMTDPDDRRSLSEPQLTAIELLVAGRNLMAVAAELEVARQTVSAWVNKDPEFRAALNRRRQELRAELHDHLRALAPAPFLNSLMNRRRVPGIELLPAGTGRP